MKIGDSLVWTNVKGTYANVQKWCSGYPFSHIAIICGQMLDEWWKYEAAEIVSANPYYPSENIIVYKCPYTEEIIREALKEVVKKSYGSLYAFLQILYFVRRKFYESKIGKPFWKLRQWLWYCPDPKLLNNWFPRGYICTELWFEVMKICAEKSYDNAMRDKMKKYNANNLYVSDCVDLMKVWS